MVQSQSIAGSPSGAANEPLILLKENRLAHAALTRLGDCADGDKWLVFLYGQAGTGKSHFLRHLVRQIRRRNPRARIQSLTATEFANRLSEAFSQDRAAEFEAELAEADFVLLEDVHALQGRAAAQRTLIAVLDDLKRRGGRVVATGRSLPGGAKGLLPRLANRFRGGATVGLELLSESSRASLARHLAASRVIPLSEEAAQVIAKEGPSTPREILAALINLDAGTRRDGKACDADLVRAHLRAAKVPRDRSISRVAKSVANFYGIPLAELRSPGRQQRSVLARQVAMLLARDLSGCSAASIARFFGRKNHTTVVHACRRTRALLSADPMFAREIDRLRRSLAQ